MSAIASLLLLVPVLAAPVPQESSTPDHPTTSSGGMSSGAYVGIALGTVVAVAIVLYWIFTFQRASRFKNKIASDARSRLTPSSTSRPVPMSSVSVQPPAAAPTVSRGISRLFRNATTRRGNNGQEDTERLIPPSQTRSRRSNSATPSNNSGQTSFSEVDLDRHPSLASVYRKSVKCLTQRELNSMFPAVEYGELSYNMKLQNIDRSNIYTTISNISGGVEEEENNSLGFVQTNNSLFEAYGTQFPKPKKVDSDDESDSYSMGPYDDENVCIICQGDLERTDLVRMLSCHHIFHDACVSPWILEKNGTCPLCKRDLLKEVPARVTVDQDEKIGSRLDMDNGTVDLVSTQSAADSADATTAAAGPSSAAARSSSSPSSSNVPEIVVSSLAPPPSVARPQSSQSVRSLILDDDAPRDSSPSPAPASSTPETNPTTPAPIA